MVLFRLISEKTLNDLIKFLNCLLYFLVVCVVDQTLIESQFIDLSLAFDFVRHIGDSDHLSKIIIAGQVIEVFIPDHFNVFFQIVQNLRLLE